MPSAPQPIISPSTAARGVDPFMSAVVALLDASTSLPELTTRNVFVAGPQDSAETTDETIEKAAAKSKGLAAVVVAGGGKNPDKSAPGPRMTADFEIQLFWHPAVVSRTARQPLALVADIMRALHQQIILPAACSWQEEIFAVSYEPMDDADYIAYRIAFERDMQL